MNSNFRQHVTVLVAAALGVMIGSVGPGVAQAAYDAVNADKVDGKHAVGYGATTTQRRGKLVATNATTGLLPNNIIRRAQDSARINGYGHAALRSMPLLVQGAGVEGTASANPQGVTLPNTTAGGMRFGFIVPSDHLAGAPIYADIVYATSPGCTWYAMTSGLEGPDPDIHNGAWVVSGTSYEGTVTAPATGVGKKTFRWPFQSDVGQFIQFAMTRVPDNAADNCGSLTVYGVQIRY
jgi:hypothetical protein